MNCARCSYYTDLVAENSSDQRKLFRTTKYLLCEPSDMTFPEHITPDDLANNFGKLFMQKIDGINSSLDDALVTPEASNTESVVCADEGDVYGDATFTTFESLTQDQVAELIQMMPKNRVPWILCPHRWFFRSWTFCCQSLQP